MERYLHDGENVHQLLWLIDINAMSGPYVLAHVISLVGWPKHVKSSLSLSQTWPVISSLKRLPNATESTHVRLT